MFWGRGGYGEAASLGTRPHVNVDALLDACRDPGFTPGARHVAPLLAAWREADRSGKKVIAGALARGDAGVARALLDDATAADASERAVRVRALGRIHRRSPQAEFEDRLPAWLTDPEPLVVREAARVVGKLETGDVGRFEDALISVCGSARPPEIKAAVDALGRVGAGRSEALLQDMGDHGDADLRRRIDEARALLQRRAGRVKPARVRLDQELPAQTSIVIRYRADVGWVVAEQLGPDLVMVRASDTTSVVTGSHCLDRLHRARSALDFGLRFSLPAGPDLAARVVAGLRQPALVAAVQAWTEGPVRFRLALMGEGRRRSVLWRVARELASTGSPLVNDSRDALWSVEIDEGAEWITCVPRSDPRFAYREADVPAASHPTLAATLAWIAAPRPGETVWDPFCGSAGELIECTRLASDLHLWGTDVSETALRAAETNVAAAGLDPSRVALERTDALHANRSSVSLVVTNPPMGRRVARDGSLKSVLEGFVRHAGGVLAPGGRLVWVTPLPDLTGAVARQIGLSVEDLGPFDMGGFVVGLQRLVRPR